MIVRKLTCVTLYVECLCNLVFQLDVQFLY